MTMMDFFLIMPLLSCGLFAIWTSIRGWKLQQREIPVIEQEADALEDKVKAMQSQEEVNALLDELKTFNRREYRNVLVHTFHVGRIFGVITVKIEELRRKESDDSSLFRVVHKN
jgi:hypothetical protein